VTAPLSPQQLVERALAAATTDGCFAIAGSESIANLRWANNTLTTNGVSENLELTVVAIVNGSDGTR
jgi:glucokinase